MKRTVSRRINKFLTKRMYEILVIMRGKNDEDADYDVNSITCSGKEWWVGDERISSRTAHKLLRLCAISAEGGGGFEETDRCVYFWLNSEGQKLRDDPDYVPIIIEHYRKNGLPV